jgi:hypothetical protein
MGDFVPFEIFNDTPSRPAARPLLNGNGSGNHVDDASSTRDNDAGETSDGDARPKQSKQRSKYKFRLLRDMSDSEPAKDWIVKDVIALGETSSWIAPPGKMKSALLAELAYAVASRRSDWHGFRIKRAGAAVYFALERYALTERRFKAYRTRNNNKNAPVAVVPATIDLMDPRTVEDVVAVIRAVEEGTTEKVVLVIFDTFAKLIAAGGGDEDKAKDQGRVFANIQRLKDKVGCHVALIGHTGKDETRGARGSSAILGDADVMVTIGGDAAVKTAAVIKANDAPEGPLFSFTSEAHHVGVDDDGDDITVHVVSPESVSAQPGASRLSRWPKSLKLVHEAIVAAHDVATDHRVAGDGPTVKAVPVQAARAIHNQRYVSTGEGDRAEAERKAWGRGLKAARAANLISGELAGGMELIWLTS